MTNDSDNIVNLKAVIAKRDHEQRFAAGRILCLIEELQRLDCSNKKPVSRLLPFLNQAHEQILGELKGVSE
jgi:hypothetical protein